MTLNTLTHHGVLGIKLSDYILNIVISPRCFRYKCPKCRAPFCCVQCSKDHKAKYCPQASSTVDKTTKNDISTIQSSQYVPTALLTNSQVTRKRKAAEDDESDSHDDEPGWNITPEMKMRLQQSSWLRKQLQDGGLRHLIGMIDVASDDEKESECIEKKFSSVKRSKGSNMHAISSRVLALARSKNSHPIFAAFIDQLLLTAGVLQPAEGEEGTDGPLSLVPVPRRAGAGTHHDGSEESSSEEDSDSDSSDGSGESSGSSEEDNDSDDGSD